jgi:hypothetical protein
LCSVKPGDRGSGRVPACAAPSGYKNEPTGESHERTQGFGHDDGIDAPCARALARQGYDFALRYYSHDAAKNLSLGVRAALYVAADGEPTYRVGVYGSGLCCGTLVERGMASLSWLSQSTGYAGSRQYAEQQRYDLIQMLPARILGEDGVVLHVDPDASHPQHEVGLFRV